VLNEVFYLPKLDHKAEFIKQTIGGWEFNTIFTAENGNSMTVYQNGVSAAGALVDPSAPVNNCSFNGASFPCALSSLYGTGYTNNQRPNIVPGQSCNSGRHGQFIMNPNAFTLIGMQLGTPGNAPRGACQGPHFVNGDLGLYKNWHFKEKYNLRFSMDFFNAFNHTNFDANAVQGVGSQSGFFYNGSGVYCGGTHPVSVPQPAPNPPIIVQMYNPCSPTNNTITAYGNTSATRGGANGVWGIANGIKPARELQYGLKFTF